MSNYFAYIPLLGLLSVGGFAAFWCLIVKMLSRAGWQRLAPFQVAESRAGAGRRLRWARLGGVSYKGIIKARALPEGLALESLFLFRVGHPPLLVPWAAFGPLRGEQSFWNTVHTTDIRTSDGGSIAFCFASDQLAAELQPRLATTRPQAGGLTRE